MTHLPYSTLLRCDDCFKNRPKFRTDMVSKGIFRHFYSAPMMGNHFPHKITIHLICDPGVSHITKHPLHNLIYPILVMAQLLLAIAELTALTLNLLHIFNTFHLLRNNSEGNLLKWNTRCILQNIPGHFDGRPVMGNHLE